MRKRAKTAIVHLNTRIREPLREKLERAAKNKGCSINAEVVDRLERSFERAALLHEVHVTAYGEVIADALPKIAHGLRTVLSANELHGAGKIDKATRDSIASVGLKQADEAFTNVRGKVNG
jgi:hypothetical protein